MGWVGIFFWNCMMHVQFTLLSVLMWTFNSGRTLSTSSFHSAASVVDSITESGFAESAMSYRKEEMFLWSMEKLRITKQLFSRHAPFHCNRVYGCFKSACRSISGLSSVTAQRMVAFKEFIIIVTTLTFSWNYYFYILNHCLQTG